MGDLRLTSVNVLPSIGDDEDCDDMREGERVSEQNCIETQKIRQMHGGRKVAATWPPLQVATSS